MATVVPFGPVLDLGGGAALRITGAGLQLRRLRRSPFAPVSIEELRNEHPLDHPVWMWLAQHGHRAAGAKGSSG